LFGLDDNIIDSPLDVKGVLGRTKVFKGIQRYSRVFMAAGKNRK
jgi:hypothetical protein